MKIIITVFVSVIFHLFLKFFVVMFSDFVFFHLLLMRNVFFLHRKNCEAPLRLCVKK